MKNQGNSQFNNAELCKFIYEKLAVIDFHASVGIENDLIAEVTKIMNLCGYDMNLDEINELNQFANGISC